MAAAEEHVHHEKTPQRQHEQQHDVSRCGLALGKFLQGMSDYVRIERIIRHARLSAKECDASKVRTISERTFADISHAGRNDHLRQASASTKSHASDTRHATFDFCVCQAFAPVERLVSKNSDGAGNSYACQAFAFGEAIPANVLYAIRNRYACQAAASMKGTFADVCDTARNLDVSQGGAVAERPVPDIVQPIGD